MPKKLKALFIFCIAFIIIFVLAYINRDRVIESLTYDENYNYIGILQSSPKYDHSENTNIVFTYEESTSEDLANLRGKYKLNEVAGTGTDFDRTKNILLWLNNLIPQDGREILPKQRDSISLITHAQESKTGLNCRGLSIILNEALLSVGIKSRYLGMKSRDFSIDSHVVVMAYIPEFEKWIYLDPSYNAYFIDDYNIPMSPKEVRQSFIDGKKLNTNSDISWSGRDIDIVYTHYISKNIYRFISPVYSSYGYDSSNDKQFIILNPKGDSNPLFRNIFTNTVMHNEDIFWAKP